jgi:vibriolysin
MVAGLQVGAPVNGLVAQSGWNYYHFSLNSIDPVVLSVVETGSGDCDLYVKEGAVPTRFDFDYFDIDTIDEFNLTIDEPGSATWYIGIYGWQATTYTLTLLYKGSFAVLIGTLC